MLYPDFQPLFEVLPVMIHAMIYHPEKLPFGRNLNDAKDLLSNLSGGEMAKSSCWWAPFSL